MIGQHTPGPWGLTTTYPEGQWVLYSKSAKGPGEHQSRDVGRFIGSDDDAHLIAAAPELLSALARLQHNFTLLLAGKPVRDVAETEAEVNAAIAKARGNHP